MRWDGMFCRRKIFSLQDCSWRRLVVAVMVEGWRGGRLVWLYIYVRLPCGRILKMYKYAEKEE